MAEFFVESNVFDNNPISVGDIISISAKKEFKNVPIRNDKNDIVGWEKDLNTIEWWLTSYITIS